MPKVAFTNYVFFRPIGARTLGIVAPDHPAVKNVQNDFDTLFNEAEGRVRFFGNVNVGRDISVEELRRDYDAVVMAYGCQSDTKLGIPGEDTLKGVLSAREFVAWYNGHPDFVHIGEIVASTLSRPQAEQNDPTGGKRHVVVIGQGNVAIDCARILTKGTEQLYDTDIASHALSTLGETSIEHVSIIGRRGLVQGAFTIKELRELTKLDGVSFHVQQEDLDKSMTESSIQELDSAQGRPKQRIKDLLYKVATKELMEENTKHIHLRFLLNPKHFQPKDEVQNHLGSLLCERTTLQGEPGNQRAIGTGEFENIPADLALISIGYRGTPIPGVEQYFDERRGVLRNVNGKVDDATSTACGLYVAGWLKRGPTGIIGTNIPDAKDTVATIVDDLGKLSGTKDTTDIVSVLDERSIEYISWEGYRKIEDAEQQGKRSVHQPREKIVNIETQIKIAMA